MPKVPTAQEAQRLRPQNPTGLGRTPGMGEAVQGFGRSLQQLAEIEKKKKKAKDKLDVDKYIAEAETALRVTNSELAEGKHEGNPEDVLKNRMKDFEEENLPKYGSHLHQMMKTGSAQVYNRQVDRALHVGRQRLSAEIQQGLKDKYNNFRKAVMEDPSNLEGSIIKSVGDTQKYFVESLGMAPEVAVTKAQAFKKTLINDAIQSHTIQGDFRSARKVALQYAGDLGTDLEKVTNAIEDRENKEYNMRYTRRMRNRAESEYQRKQAESRLIEGIAIDLEKADSPWDIRMVQHSAEIARRDGRISSAGWKKVETDIQGYYKEYSALSDLELSRMMFESTPAEMREAVDDRLKQFRISRKDAATWYRRIENMKPGKNPREWQTVKEWIKSRFEQPYFKKRYQGHLAARAEADAMMKTMELVNSGQFRDLKKAATIAVYGFNPGSKSINIPNIEGIPFESQNSPQALTAYKLKYTTEIFRKYPTMKPEEKEEAKAILIQIDDKLDLFQQEKDLREMTPEAMSTFLQGYQAMEDTFEQLNIQRQEPVKVPFDNQGLFP